MVEWLLTNVTSEDRTSEMAFKIAARWPSRNGVKKVPIL